MPAPISLLTTYDKQCDDMVELYRSGKTQKEIGDIYGLPRRSVMKILTRLGVHKSHAEAQKSRFDPDFVEFVLKHRSEGKSIEEIAFNAGRSASAVHRVLQRKNDNKPNQKQEVDEALIITMYESGQSINKISTKIGVNSIKITNILRNNNIKLRDQIMSNNKSRSQEINLPEFDDTEHWWVNAYTDYGVPTLAAAISWTGYRIRKRLQELHINKKTLSERASKLNHSDIVNDYKQLNSMNLVAKKHKCAIQTIKNHLLKEGISPNTTSKIMSGSGNPFYGKKHPKEVVDYCKIVGSANGERFWVDNPEYKEVVRQKNKEIWSDLERRRASSRMISELRKQGKCGSAKGVMKSRFGDIGFDSSYEYMFIEWCEKDQRIVYLEREFMVIEYEYNGHRCFVPDFKIWLANGSFLIVEIKSEWYAKKPKEKAKISSAFGVLADRFMVAGKSFDLISERIDHSLEPIEFNFDDVNLEKAESGEYDNFYATFHYLGRTGRRGKTFTARLNGRIIAAATFSSIARNESAIRLGLSPSEIRELSRFCIHPDYHKKNFGSWFLSRATKFFFADYPDVNTLITFADTTAGHTGTLYKSANWIYDGNTKPGYRYIDKNGCSIHKKTVYDQASAAGKCEREWAELQGLVKIREEIKLRFVLKRSN